MTTLKIVLQTLSKGLKVLAQEVEKMEKAVDRMEAKAPKKPEAKPGPKPKPKTKRKPGPKPKKRAKPKPTPKKKQGAKPKPKKSAAKKEAVRRPRKGTATDAVYTLIARSRSGVDTATLKKKTEFPDKKIWNIINRLKREKKIESTKRGVYIKT
jgi:outer membrane biosynthesis protein TonB